MMKIQEKSALYGWINLTRVYGDNAAGRRVLASYDRDYPSRQHRLVEVLPGGRIEQYRVIATSQDQC